MKNPIILSTAIRPRRLITVSIIIIFLLGIISGIVLYQVKKNSQKPPVAQTKSQPGGSSLKVEPLSSTQSNTADKYTAVARAIDSATTPAEIDKALLPFAQDYGITIKTTHEVGSSYMRSGGLTWQDINADSIGNAKNYSKWLINEWTKYPVEWVKISGIKRIVFVNRMLLPGSTTEIGGTNDLVDSSIYLNVSNVNFNYDYSALTIHHEFAHLIDYNFWGNYAQKAEWISLNPPGFVYLSEQGTNPATRTETPHPQLGFVTGHSLYNFQEDRADTYSYLFTTERYKQLIKWLPEDIYLSKKVSYYKNVISARVPSMNDAYFESINK